jgi:hypothetical protein
MLKKDTERTIREHVSFSIVAGAIPFPVVDIAAVTAIQLDMLKQLADHYEVDFNRERGKSLSSSLFSATVGSLIGRTGASMIAVKESFQDYLKKGKGVAEEMKDKTGKEDILKTIGKLDTLRKSGAITEREFEKTKKELLARIRDDN